MPADIAPAVTRLWFRLDEVLPLAEHAMATTRHTLTRAQVLAGAPLRPALIWHGTAGADSLSSNGHPGWHDNQGRPHQVNSYTWWHRESRRFGVAAATGGDRHGYLPLTALPGERVDVIDWLRAHRDTRTWLTLDVSGQRSWYTEGHLGVHDYHGGKPPADCRWRPATVACVPTLGGGEYPALIAENYLNNSGGELTRFDRTTIDEIVTDLDAARATGTTMPGEHSVLRWRGDDLDVLSEHDTGEQLSWHLDDVVTADDDGRYPLGAFTWPWLTTSAPVS